jgi:DNA mismatch endonuclease (patch repair protein)
MSQIKGKNTRPEIKLRKLIFSLGYRYRLHVTKLPGKPDLVFPGRKKVIFLHGCFWHSHACKYGNVKPVTNSLFWEEKRSGTKTRDMKNIVDLETAGWKTLVVWECQLKDENSIRETITKFLNN